MHYVRKFDSIGAMVEAASKGSDDDKSRSSRRQHGGDSWDLGVGWDGAVKLAASGWDEPRADVDRIVGDINETMRDTTDLHWVAYHDVVGGTVDVGAYLQGIPECMIDHALVEQTRPNKVVTVLVNAMASGGVSAKSLVKRGSAVCGLVESLTKLGYSVELWFETTIRSLPDLHTTLVRVKAADEWLDIDAIMFAIAHPACYRRIMFGVQDAESTKIRTLFCFGKGGGGYGGTSHTYKLEMADHVQADVTIETSLYLGRDVPQPESDPIAFIKGVIDGLNLESD